MQTLRVITALITVLILAACGKNVDMPVTSTLISNAMIYDGAVAD